MKVAKIKTASYETMTILLENKVDFYKKEMIQEHNFILNKKKSKTEDLEEAIIDYQNACDELEVHKGWSITE